MKAFDVAKTNRFHEIIELFQNYYNMRNAIIYNNTNTLNMKNNKFQNNMNVPPTQTINNMNLNNNNQNINNN